MADDDDTPSSEGNHRPLTAQQRFAINNPERVKEIGRAYCARNREKRRESTRQWRAANPARAKEYNKEWRRAHPEYDAAKTSKRRALKLASDEHYTAAELLALRAKAGGKCAYCNKKRRLTVDHIVALARGGSNSIRNIQFLCRPCNSAKKDRDPIIFAQSQGLLL